MKSFIKKFLTVSVLVISNLSSSAIAGTVNADISVSKINNLAEKGITGNVIDNYTISDSFMKRNEIKVSDIKGYDSVIIPNGTEDKVSTETEKVVYDTVEWTESVKANIKIGEACINGDKGRNTFNTATYIQADTKSSMFPVDAVSYLMSNLNIGEVKTIMGKNGNSVTIDCNGKKIEFTAGSNRVIIDDYAKDVDNGAVCEFNDGKLFIPLRSFSNAIDCKIDWIADGKIVNLEKTFNRKSKIKRIETVEPSTETTTKSSVPVVSRYSKCTCPSYCLVNYTSTSIISITPRYSYAYGLCEHCKKCDVCNKHKYCYCSNNIERSPDCF